VFNGGEETGGFSVLREVWEGGEGGIARRVFPPEVGKALDYKGAKGEFEKADGSGSGQFGKGDLHWRHVTEGVEGGDGSGAEGASDETQADVLDRVHAFHKRKLWAVRAEPDGRSVGEDGVYTGFDQNTEVFLMESPDRISEDADAIGNGSGPVAHDFHVFGEAEFGVKEDAEPTNDFFRIDPEIFAVKGGVDGRQACFLAPREVDKF
jgi:hypothetical protein